VHIEVAYSLSDHQHRVHLEMVEGALVADALAAVSRVSPFCDLDLDTRAFAVFGRRVTRNDELSHGDRIDILRPLLIDPKEARRRRAAGE
jgi:putative ubiquitin-RnfH superfamily antitoxin RatB of RatAB toxin-antitoxin module